MMFEFRETYDSRKKEITDFIELMHFLQNQELLKEDGISNFDKFFHSEPEKINLTYQSLINILKSNISLMIYNLIEYTVTNLINCIYDEIRSNNLTYQDVNHYIRKLWREGILKAVNDPTANYNTFIKKNEEIINVILNNITLDMDSKNGIPGGNLGGVEIKTTFENHGVRIVTNSPNYRPDILDKVKKQRNNLAHGSVSFTDALRENTITDIDRNQQQITSFLEELIDTVSTYIVAQQYKVSP